MTDGVTIGERRREVKRSAPTNAAVDARVSLMGSRRAALRASGVKAIDGRWQEWRSGGDER
jgi:hypothetical protein